MGSFPHSAPSSGERGLEARRLRRRCGGFTLLELLVASVVFIIIVGVVLNLTDQSTGQAATLLADRNPLIKTQTHAVFSQAPMGSSVAFENFDNALNATGYFLPFDDGASAQTSGRWRMFVTQNRETSQATRKS